jgi:hypothetical protein
MSTEIKIVKKEGRALAGCATLAEQDGKRGVQDESRALWLIILQALAMVTSAIRKYVGVKGSCETCGRVL